VSQRFRNLDKILAILAPHREQHNRLLLYVRPENFLLKYAAVPERVKQNVPYCQYHFLLWFFEEHRRIQWREIARHFSRCLPRIEAKPMCLLLAKKNMKMSKQVQQALLYPPSRQNRRKINL